MGIFIFYLNNKFDLMDRESFYARPDVGDAFRVGWEALRKNFTEYLLVVLIVFAVFSMSMLFGRSGGFANKSFSFLMAVFVIGPLFFGVSYFFLLALRGDDFELEDVLTGFKENYGGVILASFLYLSLVILGTMLFLIPGIIIVIRLSLMPYLIMDEKLDAMEAIRSSWDMTRDHFWTIFWFWVAASFIVMLGSAFFVIGSIPAIMLVQTSFTALYLGIRDEFELADDFNEHDF